MIASRHDPDANVSFEVLLCKLVSELCLAVVRSALNSLRQLLRRKHGSKLLVLAVILLALPSFYIVMTWDAGAKPQSRWRDWTYSNFRMFSQQSSQTFDDDSGATGGVRVPRFSLEQPFDGAIDICRFRSAQNGTVSFTLEAWFRVEGMPCVFRSTR